MKLGLPWRRPDELNRPWREIDYTIIDLETTGLDLRRDTIASYGIAVLRDGRLRAAEHIYSLVRPGCALSPEAITVHALRPSDFAGAPPLAEAVGVLAAATVDRIVIAHAAWVEQAFLTRAFAEHGREFRCRVIDTAAMARAAGLELAPGRAEPDLEQLATRLGVPVVSPHHALGDAITTGHVFLALAARLDRRGYATARDFLDLTEADRCMRR
jgi:DNA polymerase-3 subunit epsilon